MTTTNASIKRTKTKINRAFTNLRKAGYFAKANHQCCQSCGWAAIPATQADRVVFYHEQDAERLNEKGTTFLSWAGSGMEIFKALIDTGLAVEWDGKQGTRIKVVGEQRK